MRLYWALAQFWVDQSYWSEAHVYLEHVLSLRVGVAEAVQVPVLLDAAVRLSEVDYQVERAEVLIQEALDLSRLAGDLPGTTFALLVRGFVAVHQDQYALAQAAFEEGAACARQGADAFMRGICLKNVVDVLLLQGDYEQARRLAEEVLAIFRELDAPRQMGEALARLGWTHFIAQGDQALATSLVEQGLAQVQELGHVATTRWALFLLGVLRVHHGQFAEARTLLEESLTSGTGQVAPRDRFQGQTRLVRLLVQQGELAEAQALSQENRSLLPASGGKWLIAGYLEGQALLKAVLGVSGAAARLWGAAEALREAIGAPMYPVDRAGFAPHIAAARAEFGEAAFTAAWTDGRQLSPEQALGAPI